MREIADCARLKRTLPLPEPFKSFSVLEIFSAMSWFGRFVGLDRHLKNGPANAIKGYVALKRWPQSFDEIVTQQVVDHPSLYKTMHHDPIGELFLCLREASPKLRAILYERACDGLKLEAAPNVEGYRPKYSEARYEFRHKCPLVKDQSAHDIGFDRTGVGCRSLR
jgi:hypothetical protein